MAYSGRPRRAVVVTARSRAFSRAARDSNADLNHAFQTHFQIASNAIVKDGGDELGPTEPANFPRKRPVFTNCPHSVDNPVDNLFDKKVIEGLIFFLCASSEC